MPLLKGEDRTGHKALFNEHFGAKYVRYDGWKLVAANGDNWHLYHMEDDETETNNLAATHPQMVKQMDSLWHAWAMKTNVFPRK